MKKILKKSLNVFAALVVLVISAFALSACGEGDRTNSSPSFEAASNVKATTIEIIDDFFERVYNNSSELGTETTYSVEQIQNKIADFEYYVEVGTIKNINEVKSISLNDTSFTENQTFYLSIGKANQLLDKVYYVEESKLYVAAPVVAFETVDNAKIKINNNEFNFDLDVTIDQINLTNVAFNGANNTASKVSDTEYNLTIKSGTEYAGLYYAGASTSDTIITKRMLNGVLSGYGIVNPVNGSNGVCSYFYPVGWVKNPAEINCEKFDGATYDYSLYIVNQQKLANVTLNVDVDIVQEVSTYSELTSALYNGKAIIKLTDNIEVQSSLNVAREIVLDMNGKRLYNTSEIWDTNKNNWSIISVGQNGKLTIKGEGTIDALENDCYAIDVRDGGNLIIENGTFIGNIHSVYVYEGTAQIKGGHYAIKQVSGADKPYEFVLNLLDENREAGTASIVVTGGTFEKFNPADCKAEGEGTNFVAEGYTSRLQEGSEDIYEVVKNS